MFRHNHFISSSVLCDGLYKLKFNNVFAETLLTLHHNVGTKHDFMDERLDLLVAHNLVKVCVIYPRKGAQISKE